MNTTIVKNVGFFDKIKSALIGLVVGPILIILCIYMLWDNEFSFIAREKAIIEGQKIVVEIDPKTPTSENNNKYVYTSGEIVSDPVLEPNLNFSINGVAVERVVEMYQWKEETETEVKQDFGGSETQTTTYNYKKVWDRMSIDSSSFYDSETHENPTEWAYQSIDMFGENAKLGSLDVTKTLQGHIPTLTRVDLGDEVKTALGTGMTIADNVIYTSEDYTTPQIGDLRIYYYMIPIGSTISALAGQKNDNLLDEYVLENGQNITWVEEGNVSAQSMFQAMKDENSLKTWAMRFIFTVLMYGGFSIFLSILPTIGSVVPFIGRIVGFGVGITALLATIILAGSTIAIAWFAARPLISLTLIAIIIALIVGIKYLTNKKETSVGI